MSLGSPQEREFLFVKTSPPAGIPQGVAGVSETRLRLAEATARPIAGEFNEERIVGRVWPAAANHVTLLELTS